jgi:hypothetical protein
MWARLFKTAGLTGVALSLSLEGLGLSSAGGAEASAWEFSGRFVSLKDGDPNTAMFEVSGGKMVEVPIESLSSASRAMLQRVGGKQSADDHHEAFPAAVTEAMGVCRHAGEVADCCRVILAAGKLEPTLEKKIVALRDEWDAKAIEGVIRHDQDWVSGDVAAAAARAADELVRQAAEMVRLGNLQLAEDKLQEASAADPASGRADFLIGLAYLGGARPDFDKAQGGFAKVIRREPDHAAAWSNLAVCELQRRRYPAAVDAFRSAVARSAEPQSLAANLAYVIRLAGDRRSRVPTKSVADVTGMYHELLGGQGLQPPDNVTAPVVLRYDGSPVGGNVTEEFLRIAPGAVDPGASANAAGIVVAEDVVAVPSASLGSSGTSGLAISLAGGAPLPGKVLATIADGTITLVECVGLAQAPVAWADASPDAGLRVLVVAPKVTGESGGVTPPGEARVAVGASGAARRRFIFESGPARPPVGAAILDQAGRLVGFAGKRPAVDQVPEPDSRAIWVGVPIEELRAVLAAKQKVPPPAASEAEPLSPEVVAGRVAAAIVSVSPAPPGP